jgi:hypothetical protein
MNLFAVALNNDCHMDAHHAVATLPIPGAPDAIEAIFAKARGLAEANGS